MGKRKIRYRRDDEPSRLELVFYYKEQENGIEIKYLNPMGKTVHVLMDIVEEWNES